MVSTHDKVKVYLHNIKKHNKDINALLFINKNIEKEAIEIDKKIAHGIAGKLAGKIIAIKSCLNVAGFPVSCGSKVLEKYYGAYDADVVQKIKQEDGLIIGMANMDEFASGNEGINSAYGVTKNPAAKDRIVGGSSSGSAAAVAARFCDMALGTDTGGSIRNPASHCGVVGIKPSYGRVSRYGLVDLAMSLDSIGPLATTVEDAALLLQVISGYNPNDPTTIASEANEFVIKKIQKLKIGVVPELEKICQDKKIIELVRKRAAEFAKKTNSEIVEIKLPLVNLAVQTYYPLVYVEFFSGTRKLDGRKYGKRFEDVAGEEVMRRVLGGMEISKAEPSVVQRLD